MADEIRSEFPLDRRTFLKAASLATAAGAWAGSVSAFAEPSPRYTRIHIPEGAHPAVRTAAEILAGKLGLKDDPISTYRGSAASRRGGIVLALKETRSVPASVSGPIVRDGYAVSADGNGLMVCGARPRSLLFAAGEPHHWITQKSGVWLRNPDFTLRLAGGHPNYKPAQLAAVLGANTFTAPLRASISLREQMPEVYAKLSADERQRLDAGAERKPWLTRLTRHSCLRRLARS